jgi:hypothetical protein
MRWRKGYLRRGEDEITWLGASRYRFVGMDLARARNIFKGPFTQGRHGGNANPRLSWTAPLGQKTKSGSDVRTNAVGHSAWRCGERAGLGQDAQPVGGVGGIVELMGFVGLAGDSTEARPRNRLLAWCAHTTTLRAAGSHEISKNCQGFLQDFRGYVHASKTRLEFGSSRGTRHSAVVRTRLGHFAWRWGVYKWAPGRGTGGVMDLTA